MTAAVELTGVSKAFGSTQAVSRVDLAIERGEFFSMLGPSGSGKTTCLRMIAGFEPPSGGTIKIDGVDVTDLPPNRRNVNTVFQDYALFPHMTVAGNVEYGLRVKSVPKAERSARANAALEQVRLSGFGDRKPNELSGGQRQRVALARALVCEPSVLLLDEPLGALDLKLREEMQIELKRLQQELGITFVFVTHDQGEALSMSDRVAVFQHGRIDQVGTPTEIYEQPRTEFVAGFVGTSNLIRGSLAEQLNGDAQTFLVRPERISVHDADASRSPLGEDGLVTVTGTVIDSAYLGSESRTTVLLSDGTELVASEPNSDTAHRASRGQMVTLAWPRTAATPIPGGEFTPASAGATEPTELTSTTERT